MTLQFDRSLDVAYGVADEVLPAIRRIVAENPGPFTFKGTATFVIGRGDVAVIDPGPANERHIDAIVAAITAVGERVSHILITHTHPDHSPGAGLLRERTGAATYGFGPHPADSDAPEDNADDDGDAAEDDGDEVEPEPVADGSEGASDTPKSEEEHGDRDFFPDHLVGHEDFVDGATWRVEALHTPGHISNHLCFALPDLGVLFTGDHVMGWSTSVISPPAGDLADYLASLRLLLDRSDSVYVPTHGSPIRDPQEFVRGLIDHREMRTAQILDHLRAGPSKIKPIVAALYVGLDPKLEKAAGRSVLAHLVDLVRRGDVSCGGSPRARATYQLA